MTQPIAHFGVLAADVEIARERWAEVLGQPFSRIVRYRSESWIGQPGGVPRTSELRQVVSFGTSPSIEIQEFAPNGTHASSKGEGGHHLGFPPVKDNNAQHQRLAALGVPVEGGAMFSDRWIIQFTDSAALDGVATEWVEESLGHCDVKDDGTPWDLLPDGTPTPFDLAVALGAKGQRPASNIVELGITVKDLDATRTRWESVTGYRFTPDGTAPQDSLVSDVTSPTIRLIETGAQARGLAFAVVEVDDLATTEIRLREAGIPFTTHADEKDPDELRVDPDFLNGFAIRFSTYTSGSVVSSPAPETDITSATEASKPGIRRDTTVEDIVSRHPSAVTTLLGQGIRCIHCGAPVWGTLEDVAREAGLTDGEIDRVVAELNAD